MSSRASFYARHNLGLTQLPNPFSAAHSQKPVVLNIAAVSSGKSRGLSTTFPVFLSAAAGLSFAIRIQ
jgi:hypothetical protein